MAQLASSRQLDPTEALVFDFPVIIKGLEDAFGRRMVSVEASSQDVDGEGDVIEQKALLDSAEDFIKNGHCDWNHFSEIGARLGIAGSPSDWIIGHPREVVDLGEGRTGVIFEVLRSADESFEPTTRIYDAIWRDLALTVPPVKYRASIYGFPKAGMIEDCRKGSCDSAATRFHISGMDWKSLALTTSPVNDSLTGFARVVTAKSFIELVKSNNSSGALSKSDLPPSWAGSPQIAATGKPIENRARGANGTTGVIYLADAQPTPTPSFPIPPPRNLSDAVGQLHHHIHKCPATGGLNSVAGFRDHFALCCGMDAESAELYSHALMYASLLEKRRRD